MPYALHALAALEMDAGEYEAAAKLFERLLPDGDATSAGIPNDVKEQAIYRLGVCLFETGAWAKAAAQFERFLGGFGESELVAPASYLCGESHFRLGQFKSAVGHLSRVAEDHRSADVCAPSMLRRGQALAELQQWPRSERTFLTFLDAFADSDRWYEARFGIGWARGNQGRHDEAIESYRHVVSGHQGPMAARAQFQIGECLFAKKEYELAARELLKVDILYAYPEWSAAALYEAGQCLERLAKLVEARAQFEAVATRFPDTQWAVMASAKLKTTAASTIPGR